jgi:hypothetical protein
LKRSEVYSPVFYSLLFNPLLCVLSRHLYKVF